jgi:hypothetical protein
VIGPLTSTQQAIVAVAKDLGASRVPRSVGILVAQQNRKPLGVLKHDSR